MRKFWVVIAGVVMGVSPRASAANVKVEVPPKVEESTPDTDKAAAHAASNEADQWAATKKSDPPKKAEEAAKDPTPEAAKATEPPKQEAAPAPLSEVIPPPEAPAAHPTYIPRPGLNEMKGKLASKSYDPRSIRVSVDGGYSVEFAYDKQTTLVNGGNPVTMDDLEYGDELLVRYAGKDLTAVEIDRVSKAPRPQ